MVNYRANQKLKSGISAVVLFSCLFLTSCKAFKSPYVEPAKVISSDQELANTVISSDQEFFKVWGTEDSYNGYILDVIDSLSFCEIKAYADSRYKVLAQNNRDKNFEGFAIYVLYCIDSGDVIVKTGDETRAFLDHVYPGDYYRLVTMRYERASLFLKSLNQFFESSQKGYEQLGFFRKKYFLLSTTPKQDVVDFVLQEHFRSDFKLAPAINPSCGLAN